MKRKLRLLLAMVLAMTMVMGISVTAFAAEIPSIDGDDSTKSFDSGIMDVDSSGPVVVKIVFDSLDGLKVRDYTYINDQKFDMACNEDYSPFDNPWEMHRVDSTIIDGLNLYVDTSDFGGGDFVYKERITWSWIDGKGQRSCYYYTTNYSPTPGPKPAPKREPESKGMDAGYIEYLMSQIKTDDAKKKVPAKAEPVRDTFKSEAPAKTVVAADAVGAASFLDLKVHGVDEKTSVNQKFLAQNLVSPSVNILLTENIYPRRELGMAEDGAAKTLSWNNLPKDQAGPVFAVVYNQKDGAYVLNGTLGANGTATFQGFKLRPASTITICK